VMPLMAHSSTTSLQLRQYPTLFALVSMDFSFAWFLPECTRIVTPRREYRYEPRADCSELLRICTNDREVMKRAAWRA
jgi:hypothetical protein